MPGEDIPALYGRLEEEVGRSAVTADRPLVRRPGVKGALAYSVRKVLRSVRGPERRPGRPQGHVRARGPNATVAYYSPMPPERSGVADYSALLLPALRRRIDVDVAARGKQAHGDVSLYHVGNDPEAHGWIIERLRDEPGIVVLHDFVLHHLVASLTLGRKDRRGYLAALERDAGLPGRLLGLGVIDGCIPPLWEVRPEDFPLCAEVLDFATGVIVHSRYVEERARARGYDGPLWRIPHPAWPPAAVTPERPDGDPVFGAFGNLNASKRVPQLLEAFARFRETHPTARLVLVGAAGVGADVRHHRLGDAVVREGYVDEDRLWALLSGVDAVVSLRSPTMGETSGIAVRALTLGKPLLVSDIGWFAELPDDVAFKIAPDELEVERLAEAMSLLSDPGVREQMVASARRLASVEHDVERVADLYVAALREPAGEEGLARELDEVQL
jgi:glycosyltransferase involved in cell wall biosynthesis